MNIKYHVACGVALDLTFGTKGLLTLFSVLPDLVLIPNEIKLLREKKAFDASEVPPILLTAYKYTHSLIFIPYIWLFFGELAALAVLIHQIADWFTHVGIFASKPLFPFSNYTVKFGRNILK